MTTSATSLAAMALQLAGATKPDGSYILPDSVRVECGGDYASLGPGWPPQPTGTHGGRRGTYSKCDCPDGRGWNALDPRFGWDWMQALAKAGHHIEVQADKDHESVARIVGVAGTLPHFYADTPGEAFSRAATKSLKLDMPLETAKE